MEKKAILFDLDNTLYPVPSIGEELFKPVFDLIAKEHADDIDAIKKEMMGTPFRKVAEKYGMNKELTEKAIAIQEDIEYNKPIAVFEDYHFIKEIRAERFLVTTGFYKMQQSKVKNMGITGDFKEFHIVDPTQTSKREIFADIMRQYNYRADDLLVVGDDPESELKAAKELGIETVLYGPEEGKDASQATYHIRNFKQLRDMLK